MAKVDVIKAQVSVTDRRRRSKSIERKRVAAYCRVSSSISCRAASLIATRGGTNASGHGREQGADECG